MPVLLALVDAVLLTLFDAVELVRAGDRARYEDTEGLGKPPQRQTGSV